MADAQVTTDSKACTRCGEVKPREAFHFESAKVNKMASRCKVCARKARRKANFTEKQWCDKCQSLQDFGSNCKCMRCERERWRKRYYASKPTETPYSRSDHRKFPLRNNARSRVTYAIKTGRLIRQPCEVCGETKVIAHHDDYAKPLDVRWFCTLHHARHHTFVLRGPGLNGGEAK